MGSGKGEGEQQREVLKIKAISRPKKHQSRLKQKHEVIGRKESRRENGPNVFEYVQKVINR